MSINISNYLTISFNPLTDVIKLSTFEVIKKKDWDNAWFFTKIWRWIKGEKIGGLELAQKLDKVVIYFSPMNFSAEQKVQFLRKTQDIFDSVINNSAQSEKKEIQDLFNEVDSHWRNDRKPPSITETYRAMYDTKY